MGQLETFIHQDAASLPLLVRAGLVHAQFESIHPFLDGNGRTAHHLYALCGRGIARTGPLSQLVSQKHRRLYYDRLNGTQGDEGWTAWLDFFLQDVRDTANQAARTALMATLRVTEPHGCLRA
jgi:Fic family protein